jgi:hypothetical protein
MHSGIPIRPERVTGESLLLFAVQPYLHPALGHPRWSTAVGNLIDEH